VAERSAVEALSFKQPGDRLKVVPPFLEPLLPGKDLEKTHVNPLVERRERRPAIQVAEGLVIGEALDKALQDLRLEASELTALRHEPRVEVWAAIQFQALKELAPEAVSKPAQLLQGMGGDAQICRSDHLQGIDAASRQIKRHSIRLGSHPACSGLIDEAPDFAEAPAQLTSWIVRDVP